MPTAAVGLITDAAAGRGHPAEGEADVVLLARARLREPSWPLRAAAELGLSWHQAPVPGSVHAGTWDDVLTAA